MFIRYRVYRFFLKLASRFWQEDRCEYCGDYMMPIDGYHVGDGYECHTPNCPNKYWA